MVGALKKVLKILVNILIYIVFGILILIIVAKVSMIVNGKDYFSILGYSVFNVATGSMEPTISQNDIIIVKDNNDLKVGDIITYQKDKSYITHRIVSMNDSAIIAKGDANNTCDNAITKDLVIGKVEHIFSNAGVWQKILTTPYVIVMIFVTLLLFDFAFSYKGNKKEKVVKEVKEINKEKKEEPKKITEEEIKVIEEKLEDKDLDYTIGLNLDEIQKEIDKKLNDED